MRIGQITFSGKGGAGIAAHRIHRAIQQQGHHSEFIVSQDTPESGRVVSRPLMQRVSSALGRLALRRYPRRVRSIWTVNTGPGIVPREMTSEYFDILNLHWLGEGFFPISLLPRMHVPVVWTLHDMWGFTGGCHYSGSCLGWQIACGKCPQLLSVKDRDLSYINLKIKKKSYAGSRLVLVSPSQWLADAVRSSAVLRDVPVYVIRNPIPPVFFDLYNRLEVRRALSLPEHGHVVFIGAELLGHENRKGSHLVESIIENVNQRVPALSVTFIVLGHAFQTPGVVGLGTGLSEAQMIQAYRAADLYVLPTTEDNLPNTVSEALATGTPVAAFAVGGLPEMVIHDRTGFLAPPLDVVSLSEYIARIIVDKEKILRFGHAAREFALENFSENNVSDKYVSLYKDHLRFGAAPR